MSKREELERIQSSLIGLSVTWVDSTYPILDEDDYTQFYVGNIYETGVITKATANRVAIQVDKGRDGIVLRHYSKPQLIENIEDEATKQIIIDSIPVPSMPRDGSVNYYVYTLSDPTCNVIHYIGISKNIQARYRQHCQCQGLNLELNLWIQELLRQGHTPQIDIIETSIGAVTAQSRETHWIEYYLSQGAPLKNIAKVDRGMAS